MYKQEYDYQCRHSSLLLGKKAIQSSWIASVYMSSLLVVLKSHLSALYNYSQFVHLNQEKGEEAAVTSNGHSGEATQQ